jgi:hypothetical protein
MIGSPSSSGPHDDRDLVLASGELVHSWRGIRCAEPTLPERGSPPGRSTDLFRSLERMNLAVEIDWTAGGRISASRYRLTIDRALVEAATAFVTQHAQQLLNAFSINI